MAMDRRGNIYTGGYTLSSDFPASKGSAFEKYNGGGNDGYIIRINNDLLAEVYDEFHDAAKNNDLKKIKRLLEANASLIDNPDRYKRTALHSAARYCAHDAVEYLTDKGADINAKDEQGNTPLHLASIFGYNEIAGLLAGKKADPDIRNDKGCTPLILAIQFSNLKTASILLNHHADINGRDRDGNTAIHLALLSVLRFKPILPMLKEKIQLYIEKGADPAIRNKEGKSPVDLAREIGDQGLIDMLKAKK